MQAFCWKRLPLSHCQNVAWVVDVARCALIEAHHPCLSRVQLASPGKRGRCAIVGAATVRCWSLCEFGVGVFGALQVMRRRGRAWQWPFAPPGLFIVVHCNSARCAAPSEYRFVRAFLLGVLAGAPQSALRHRIRFARVGCDSARAPLRPPHRGLMRQCRSGSPSPVLYVWSAEVRSALDRVLRASLVCVQFVCGSLEHPPVH